VDASNGLLPAPPAPPVGLPASPVEGLPPAARSPASFAAPAWFSGEGDPPEDFSLDEQARTATLAARDAASPRDLVRFAVTDHLTTASET
jgi:hypothetical protein